MAIFTVTSQTKQNLPASVIGNYSLFSNNRENKVLTLDMFTTLTKPVYSDTDPVSHVKILSLPVMPGVIKYNGVDITIGLEIPVSNINNGQLVYIAPDQDTLSSNLFTFTLKDSGSDTYAAASGVFNVLSGGVAIVTNHPPLVSGFNTELLSEEYQFILSNFTTDFTDFNGDSYQLVKITSLPTIGTILFNGVPVAIDFEFDIANIAQLTYQFPANYIISKDGYCEFVDDIDTIITQYNNDGYSLETKEEGYLKFVKDIQSSLPNDTDIYAFFDATSMLIADAESASNALATWYQEFNNNNPLFTGNLYILPVMKEDWLGFPTAIIRGSLAAVGNNSDRPLDDYMAFSIIPPNFDIDTDNENLAWTAPTNVLTLAFIDEVDSGSNIIGTAYHRDRNGYGFNQQPSAQYFTDYKLFMVDYPKFNFFKGIFYPIPNIEAGNFNNTYNACVLQGFAAIEGGASYTLAEIKSLGVIYAEERRFHWHLDPSIGNYTGTNPLVANPYSAEAHTAVPGVTYELQGLKDFGWIGIYDKNQPASDVFSTQTFTNDLNKYLITSSVTEQDVKIVQGTCVPKYNICFGFKTSDDSIDNLFSNEAQFCFGAKEATGENIPTVDDNYDDLILREYTFNSTNFTKNFADIDGNSFSTLVIKSLPKFGVLRKLGSTITIGTEIDIVNAASLTYTLDDKYGIYNNTLYSFRKSITDIIAEYKAQGYILTNNINGIMTFTKEGKDLYEKGTIITDAIAFNFTVKDDSSFKKESNISIFTLLPKGNVYQQVGNVNTAPQVGSNTMTTSYTKSITFNQSNFVDESDPRFTDAEGDQPYQLKVLSLPETGQLLFNEIPVVLNQIINFSDIRLGMFKYVPDVNRKDVPIVSFKRAISDTGSKIFVE